MRTAEQALIDAGTSVDQLMQVAGKGAAEWVWRIAAGRSVTVLCGPGNNGGDGYVIAECLRSRGLEVKVVSPTPPKTEAAKNARISYKGQVLGSGDGIKGGVLVDCLFGSGLVRPLSAELLLLLRDLARTHAQRVAVDLPSGVESDTGALLNKRLPEYDLTIALGAWKFAHWKLPAREIMGTQKLVSIGIDEIEQAARLIGKPTISAPPIDAHKYARGLCAVVGGEMPGASLLASQSALRAGAGYVRLLSDSQIANAPAGLVVDQRDLAESISDNRINSILVGPGLGRSEVAEQRLLEALSIGAPMVLDADALMLLTPDMVQEGMTLLATPHDGELDCLCHAFAVVASTRSGKALALAKTSGMTVLAKGPDSYVASPKGQLAIAQPATSWLSVAGTGDVLAGIAASRMATGKNPFEAACEAIWLHGRAARELGAAFTSDDLASAVSKAVSSAR